ncbi:alpha-2,8-sialyltransferase 8B-like [Diadema antillarum]|uniref:alpha-2,8-sialyltransferase 8B-like n=1 Tax=Diadema antillarum TaxID=105358 RepID=UPI003A89B48B
MRYYTFDRNATANARRGWTETMKAQRSCAIVGNSGILTDSKCGAAIDGHDYVIRINLAPIGGKFERDVGTRADLVTFNQYQQYILYEIARNPKVLGMDKYKSILWRFEMYRKSVIWLLKGVRGSKSRNDFLRLLDWLRRRKRNIRWAYPTGSLMVYTKRFVDS